MKESVLKNILSNLRAFLTINIRRRINENTKTSKEIEALLDDKLFCVDVLNYYTFHQKEALGYQKELELLSRVNKYCVFPYEPVNEMNHVDYGVDRESKMPYVVHKNHRLYFPSCFSAESAVEMYRNYILVEKLLGIDDIEGSPHQYQSHRVKVEDGDVLLDIGAAEGLFALDNIDKASKVVLLEGDFKWRGALEKTFAPFSDKVNIVEKFVTESDSDTTISLTKLLSEVSSPSFIKMDIEGSETAVVNASKEILRNTKEVVKLAIATYHKQYDYDELKSLFDQMGYVTESSNGYMLYHLYDTPVPPYFRKGIIRAKNRVA